MKVSSEVYGLIHHVVQQKKLELDDLQKRFEAVMRKYKIWIEV
jgi:hypothetical protein